MCAIAGMIDWEHDLEVQRGCFEQMQQVLHRRGPDQRGLYIASPAALVHARLSIVDPENGKQPMHLRQGENELVLIYNGELYNTPELRADLQTLGHTFRGHSDTEVLLHAYAQWGGDCVERLNGIFAFAVWEAGSQRLFLARDRIGVKPLFYTLQNNRLLFASEIKALFAHPALQPEIDSHSVAELMLIGPGRTPGYGVFRGIEEVLPAHCGYYSKNGGLQLRQYWRMEDHPHEETFDQTVEHVRALVTDAIQRQLVSDVPVGTFLSGGLDSSIISSVADRYFYERGQQLQTFSIEYKDNAKYFKASKFQPNSDDAFIAQMNAYLHAKHRTVVIDTDELVDALYEAVQARDLPGMADVDASLLLACREIKQHVSVALSGECADESAPT